MTERVIEIRETAPGFLSVRMTHITVDGESLCGTPTGEKAKPPTGYDACQVCAEIGLIEVMDHHPGWNGRF
jgi:hypothetical protein